jgi:class 3 adenylate cyclase
VTLASSAASIWMCDGCVTRNGKTVTYPRVQRLVRQYASSDEGRGAVSSKTATILVTDLVASTQLRARLGEERADRLRRLHDRMVRTCIENHGGEVVKWLGDGVLAAFGEANAALSAAVAIQQAADAHSQQHPDQPLVLRVGLSAGEVEIEGGDCFGIPVIEADRLCAAAQGGGVLAVDVVRLLARGRGGHQFTPVGDLELKGLAEPVPAVQLQWSRRRPGAPVLPFPELLEAGAALTFAGRAAELELLTAAWKKAASGERGRVLITGEAGIGKTRLASELARVVHQAGGSVLYGRCQEGLGIPYEPFVEALSFFCQHTSPEELRSRLGRHPGELTRLLPEFQEFLPGLDPPLRSEPETEQYRLFEAVASWLGAAGAATGLLVVIDDLHWAPPPTLQLFAHVFRAAGPARLLAVGTFRDTDVGPTDPLSVVLADLRRISGIERISLEGLTLDELAELVENIPRGQMDRALAATLHDGTEGNPFFVGELLRQMAEGGVSTGGLPVPDSVREVIVSRMARLTPATRNVLGVAAVLGRDVEVGPLAAIADVDEDGVIEALDEAMAVRLVEETRVGVYRFVHALVRSSLYDNLSATRRARLHLRGADVFGKASTEDPARLAHHLVASAPLGGRIRTARACLHAGDRALSVLADAEAADWYSQGLEFMEGEDDPRLRIDLLCGLGEAQRRTGDAASRQTLLDVARLAAEHGEVACLVRAVLANSRGITSIIGHVDKERLELIDTALEVVGSTPSGDRAELLALQAAELVFGCEHDRWLGAADEAAAIAARLDDVTVRARVGVRRFLTCLVPDRITAMAAEGAGVRALADATGDPQLRALSRGVWTFALMAAGQLGEARHQAAEAVRIADETGQPGLRSLAHSYYAATLDALGEHDEAARLTQAAFELGQEAAMPDAVNFYGARMWLHWTFEGQTDVAAAVAAQAYAEYPRLVAWRGAEALALALGNPSGGGEKVAEALARVPDVPEDMFWLLTHAFFAAAQGFGVENPATADAAYEILLPYRSLHAAYGIGYLGPLDMTLGVLCRVRGDLETARAHHEAAARTIEACGAARARAFNGYQWAVALLARSDPADDKHAVQLLEETLTYCRRKGYLTLAAKTEELLATGR